MDEDKDARDPAGEEVERALREYARRLEEGSAPEVEEFLAERPTIAPLLRDRLRDLFEGDRALDDLLGSSVDPAALAPERGKGSVPFVLGDFRILREVGRGGMGVVYLAKQISLRRTVALKVLPAHFTLQPETVERFRREASTAARLHHPGIVEVFAVGEAEGAHYFAMEFVEGTPLDRVVARMREESPERLETGRIEAAVSGGAHRKAEPAAAAREPPGGRTPSSAWNRTYIETVCRLVAQVADALNHAHRAGVVHRDVKPSNILVREDGTAVLTDFGLAREEGLPSMTRTGEFAGTPYYVSPEQAMARRVPVDHRTDVYSLGVTLYELLTLRRPFEGETSAEVLAKIVAKEPESPRRWNPLLPRDLVTIVLKSIEKDPARRYATAGEFAEDLRAFLSFKPIAARPSGVPTRILKFTRRHRAGSAAGAVLALAAAFGCVWWWTQPGVLRITSPIQGAVVFVDGEVRGRTPLPDLELRPGLHRVRLVKDEEDLESAEEIVSVRRGRAQALDRALASRKGVLDLSSDPQGARVTLRGAGGSEIAVPAPTPTLVDVRAGTYRARFELDGFEPQEKTVEVFSAGAKTACAMRWETGDLVLEGFQKGIQVEIHRGERIGEGTLERSVTLPLDAPIRLPSGRYALRATSEDHFARDLEGPSSASVPSGGSTRLDLWLRPVEQRLLANLKSEVHAFAFSDVDEDGLPEILVRTLRGTLTALAHDGSRRFEWSVPDSANCLATADVDGDGAEEILAATRARIVGFGPDGSRRWESAPLGGIAAMAVAQLDGRGPREVVAVTADWRIVGLALDGATLFDEPSGLEVYWLTAADLDGDGRDEVYTANEVPGEIVARRPDGSELWRKDAGASAFVGASFEMGPGGRRAVLAGNWEGRVFALDAEGEVLLDRTVQGGAYALAVIDLESDGTPEILAGTTDGRITAFTGEGARLFETQVRGGARALGSADCDGDGRPEILVGTMAGEVHSLDFQPDLAFEAEVGDQVQDLSVADLEGEGRLEVVVGTTGSVACFESSGRRRFRAVGEKSQYASPRVVDLDGDGRSEVVLGLRSGGIAEVGPDGRSREFARMDSPVYVLQAVDLDGDGRREIFAGTEDGQVVAFGRDGAPRFRHRLRGFVWSVEGGDLDGDSRPEIAAGSEGGDFVLLDASGAVRTTAAGPAPVWVITFADVDMDGTREILAGWRSGLVRVFRADGTTRTEFHAGALFALAPVDLDGDRTLEFVAGGGTSVRAFRLDGTPLWSVEALGRVWALRGADLDADGVPEVVAGTWGGEILVLDAAGRRWEAWRRAGENRGLEVADLEGDGTVEIVVGEGHRIAVYGPSGPDRRRELRRIFFEAIEALDREEEAAAAEGFERARFRWLAFDPSGVEGARARLALHRNSPSARKMSAILERVRPGTALGAVEGIGQLVDRGLYDAATASAKDLRSRLQEDPALAEALNALAWKLVDPASPHPPARTVALELARAAVSANPERSAFSLDTLAEALHANGRSREAVEVETEALSRCPPENASLRQAIEASLARFRAAAEGRGER